MFQDETGICGTFSQFKIKCFWVKLGFVEHSIVGYKPDPAPESIDPYHTRPNQLLFRVSFDRAGLFCGRVREHQYLNKGAKQIIEYFDC